MTDLPDFAALARQHMALQVSSSFTTETILRALWERTVDPKDFQRTFEAFRTQAALLIQQARLRGVTIADDYFQVLAQAGKFEPLAATLSDIDADAVRALGVNKAVLSRAVDANWLSHLSRQPGGLTDEQMASALSALLGTAKRQIVNGSRSRLISRSRDNRLKWARVSDGHPCAFCAMLVSRGPAYVDELSGSFPAHIRCGCNARPVTRNDPDGGWSNDAQFYRMLWDRDLKAADPTGGLDDVKGDFRQVLTAAQTRGLVPA